MENQRRFHARRRLNRRYLANDEADRQLLLDFVRRTRTREIVVAVLSLELR